MATFAADPADLHSLPAVSPISPSSMQTVTAFSRFEFESGKGNEGTKVLMVEWEDDDVSRTTAGAWTVSWPDKSQHLHVDDSPGENIRRLYFLLGPGQTVPPTITLTYQPPPDSAATAKKPIQVLVNPLPAIFPPELGAEARQSGKRGVLHTIWAKQRLRVLEKEIQYEGQLNVEGIALQMAITEKDWIENNFGVESQRSNVNSVLSPMALPASPTPKTPGGSRLNEKLKGLSLGTSEKVLNRKPEAHSIPHQTNPFSPEHQDVAVSIYGTMRASSPKSTVPPIQEVLNTKPPILEAPRPFDSLTREQSMDSDDLFAIALSPRTEALGKSPFTFSKEETMPYLQRNGRS